MNFADICKRYDTLRINRDLVKQQLKITIASKKKASDGVTNSEKALAVVQDVAQFTQQKLEFRISKLVSTALSAVFPDPPEFLAKFVIRRNQTECDLLFVENHVEQKPADSSGGGTIDVASFALRIARWSLNKNRPTFILDEPFRNVSPDLQYKVSEMTSMISSKVGLQILMVSHAERIDDSADKLFLVDKKGNKSYVRKMDNDV